MIVLSVSMLVGGGAGAGARAEKGEIEMIAGRIIKHGQHR